MKNYMKNFLPVLFILFAVMLNVQAQESSVEGLRSKANALRKEIEKKEAILLSSQKDINSRLANLKIITAKIDEYKGLVSVLQKEVRALDNKMAALDKEMKAIGNDIKEKEKSVEISRAEYAEALRKARKYSNFENKMLFVFSAEDFDKMARRYRYANSYMNAHKVLADSLKKKIGELEIKQGELQAKRDELEVARTAKKASLKEQEAERARIQKLEYARTQVPREPARSRRGTPNHSRTQRWHHCRLLYSGR